MIDDLARDHHSKFYRVGFQKAKKLLPLEGSSLCFLWAFMWDKFSKVG
jgi:hypothetical protein